LSKIWRIARPDGLNGGENTMKIGKTAPGPGRYGRYPETGTSASAGHRRDHTGRLGSEEREGESPMLKKQMQSTGGIKNKGEKKQDDCMCGQGLVMEGVERGIPLLVSAQRISEKRNWVERSAHQKRESREQEGGGAIELRERSPEMQVTLLLRGSRTD